MFGATLYITISTQTVSSVSLHVSILYNYLLVAINLQFMSIVSK